MGRKFFITPTGHCSVFLKPHSAAQSTDFDSYVLPGSPSASVRSPQRSAASATNGNASKDGAVPLSLPMRSDAMARREAAGNVLQPLLNRSRAQTAAASPKAGATRPRPKLPTKPLDGLEPWEEAELRYLKDLQQSAFGPSFGAGLLDCYWKGPLASTPASPGGSMSVGDHQRSPMAGGPASTYSPSSQVGKRNSVTETLMEAAMAMPLPEAPQTPKTPRIPQLPSSPHAALSPSCKVGVPLTLPGMQSLLAEHSEVVVNGKTQVNLPHHSKSKRLEMQEDSYFLPSSIHRAPALDANALRADATTPKQADSKGHMAKSIEVSSPFFKFLKKPRKENGFMGISDFDEMSPSKGDRKDDQNFGFSQPQNDNPQKAAMQSDNLQSAKTGGMIGGLQNWLNSGAGQGGGGGAAGDNGPGKNEWSGIIALSKKYGLPVGDIRELSVEFRQYSSDNTWSIPLGEFIALVRKRTNLDEEKDIPFHLLKGIPQDGSRISFEDFLKWSILTAWSEEMMMPCADERQIRQLAREQDMRITDVEKVKQFFDEFDTDGSAEIEEDEFRNILYKLLKVKNISDVPLKRLQRYWREVDIDGSGSIGFDEFLIWYKTSFAKDGLVEL